MTTMTTADDLRATADYISERGWARGAWETKAGEVCLVTALWDVTNPHVDQTWRFDTLRFDRACAVMRLYTGWGGLSHWNDEVCEDQEHVILSLKRAAAMWEENGDGEAQSQAWSAREFLP